MSATWGNPENIYSPRVLPLVTLSGLARRCFLPMRNSDRHPRTLATRTAGEPCVETVEVEEDDRRRVKRQRLADDQPADDRIAERLADLRSRAGAEHQRNAAEKGGHRRHHDRPEAQQTRLADRVDRCQAATALRLDCEVD